MDREKLIIVSIIVAMVVVIWWNRKEMFGESIGMGGSTGAEVEERAQIFSSGATMRNVGTLLSSTNQDTERYVY